MLLHGDAHIAPQSHLSQFKWKKIQSASVGRDDEETVSDPDYAGRGIRSRGAGSRLRSVETRANLQVAPGHYREFRSLCHRRQEQSAVRYAGGLQGRTGTGFEERETDSHHSWH